MGAEMKIDGIQDFVDDVMRMYGSIENIADEALQAGGKVIFEEAERTNAFNDRTGTLRKAIKLGKTKGSKGQKYVLIGVFSKKAWYGRLKEYGTKKMAATPFLRPAFETKKDEALKEIGRVLKEAIDRGL
jgi:HK97 gp10 family phage protein